MPEWVIQTAVVTALAVIGWYLRGLRTDVDSNKGGVDAIKLDLARNYVTHRQLRGLRNDLRNAMAMMNHLQLELASKFKFKPFVAVPDPSSEFDQEPGNDGD